MPVVYLGLGSNEGDRLANFTRCSAAGCMPKSRSSPFLPFTKLNPWGLPTNRGS